MKVLSHFATKKYNHLTKRMAPAMLAGRQLLFVGLVCAGLLSNAPGARALDDDGHNATPITACGCKRR